MKENNDINLTKVSFEIVPNLLNKIITSITRTKLSCLKSFILSILKMICTVLCTGVDHMQVALNPKCCVIRARARCVVFQSDWLLVKYSPVDILGVGLKPAFKASEISSLQPKIFYITHTVP